MKNHCNFCGAEIPDHYILSSNVKMKRKWCNETCRLSYVNIKMVGTKQRQDAHSNYRKRHAAKCRERVSLVHFYGTSMTTTLCKKMHAICKALQKNRLDKEVLNYISKGETENAFIFDGRA